MSGNWTATVFDVATDTPQCTKTPPPVRSLPPTPTACTPLHTSIDPAAHNTASSATPATLWLYALALANYDPPHLVDHFLSHALNALALSPANVILLLNCNPLLPAVTSLGALHAVATTHNVTAVHRWLGQYSGWAHMELQLRLLQHVPVQDWVLLARVDELVQPPPGGLAAAVEAAQAEGASWVAGRMRERAAADGQRRAIGEADGSLASQFPLRCGLDDALHVVVFQARCCVCVGCSPPFFPPPLTMERSKKHGGC